MGLTCITVCLQCRVSGPPIGDYGVLGYPSLDRQRGDHSIPNFGSLYAGFTAIHLRTWPIESYRVFLEAHAGHQMDVFADGGPMFGDTEGHWTPGGEPAWTEEQRSSYPLSFYRLSCNTCREVLQSGQPANLAVFPPSGLESESISVFVSNVGAELASAAYRSWPLSESDLAAIAQFLRDHRDHLPVADAVRHPEA